jgi:HEPN domain-containing protein
LTRKDFQTIAEERLRDVQALLRAKRYSGCYYLAGYVVECALKACIAKQTRRYEFPDKDKARNAHVHKLADLLKLVDSKELEDLLLHDPRIEVNWQILKDWSEESRYRMIGKIKAESLLKAVADLETGVLACIRRFW